MHVGRWTADLRTPLGVPEGALRHDDRARSFFTLCQWGQSARVPRAIDCVVWNDAGLGGPSRERGAARGRRGDMTDGPAPGSTRQGGHGG